MKTDPNSPIEPAARPGRRFAGLGVSPGIAIGRAHIIESGTPQVPEYRLLPDAIPEELARFTSAVTLSIRQVEKLKNKAAELPAAAGEEVGILLDAYIQMLQGSRLIRGVETRISTKGMNAEWAVQAVLAEISDSFRQMDDPYLAGRLQDIREVGGRLVRNLTRTPYQAFEHVPEGAVLVAEEMTPADTALLNPRKIAGFITALGGAQGHTAIMARSLGIPAVLGATAALTGLRNGDPVIVDGGAGLVVADPDAAELAAFRDRRAALDRARLALQQVRDLPAVTRDGVSVALHANIELPAEFGTIAANGAEGVGLLRSEFMFMNRDDLPGEDEQARVLTDLVTAMDGRPVTVRTLDLGGEKLANSLQREVESGPNPALGLRAVRLSLRRPELLETQLGAILRASIHGPVRVMVPMVSHAGELREVRETYHRVAARLRAARVSVPDPLPPLGAMIEIPGAALAADSLARHADFFAIGTNDLTQYTLAIDRSDEQVAHLYDPLHPAVLRLIQFTVAAAERAGIALSLCGEMAGDPRYTALLVGLGVRELSMAPTSILAVKQRLRQMRFDAAERHAAQIMGMSDSTRIAVTLDDFNDMMAAPDVYA